MKKNDQQRKPTNRITMTVATRSNQQQHDNQPARYENTGAGRLLKYATCCWVRTPCHLLGTIPSNTRGFCPRAEKKPSCRIHGLEVSSLVGDSRTRTSATPRYVSSKYDALVRSSDSGGEYLGALGIPRRKPRSVPRRRTIVRTRIR
jgi:hypothetical protein